MTDSYWQTTGPDSSGPAFNHEDLTCNNSTRFRCNYTLTHTGYLLIPNGEHMLLLDTGAPTSFGKGLKGVPGVPDDPPEAMLEGLTIDWLVDHVRHGFHGLVGAEVLRERTLIIDPHERTAELTTDIIDRNAGMPVRHLMNVPIFDGAVAGKPAEIIFDTGAPLGFVPAELVAGLQPVDRIAEFYPLFGPFETDVFELPLQIGDECPTLRFGVLPDQVAQMHAAAQLPVLIGLGLLERYRISIGLREKRLRLEPV